MAALTVWMAAAQTQIDLRTQAKRVDFTAATSTRPIKTGTELPATCAAGEMFFKTDAPGGANVYGCAEANQWSLQSGKLTVASEGTTVGSRPKANFLAGPGLISLISDTGEQIDVTWALDTAVVQTQAGEQGGGARLCASQSNAAKEYRCMLNPTIGSYKTGMVLHWIPDVSSAGGPTTLNVDTLGAVRVKLRDGVTDPSAADIMGGQLYAIWYDGLQFRLMMPTAATTLGSVLSVFGRQGAIVPQSGDYTTDQVTEGGSRYFTDERARAAVKWETLGDKPSAFPPLQHGASHKDGGGDEIASLTPAPNAIPKAGSDGKLDTGWFSVIAGGLGYTAEDVAKRGQANGYAPLDSAAKVPAGHIPALPYEPALEFIPENEARKGQANGYASLDGAGKVPIAQLPGGGSGLSMKLTFDGVTADPGDGSALSWTCGSGTGSQCTASWSVPEGVNWVRVQAWGGGGGGSAGNGGNFGGPGGGGGGYVDTVCPVTPGAAVTVVAGRGGAGSTNPIAAADNGGNSSFGTCFTVTGGGGHPGTGHGALGGMASGMPMPLAAWISHVGTGLCSQRVGADIGGCHGNRPDVGGGGAGSGGSGGAKNGGSAVYAGGGGGNGVYDVTPGGLGGISAIGGGHGGNGGGYDVNTSQYTSCTDGTAPGGGGGGMGAHNSPNQPGCNGARGEVRVFYAK